MKRSAICLMLTGSLFLTMKVIFAQEAPMVNQAGDYNSDDAQVPNTQGNADEMYVPVNGQDNSDVTMMPFVQQDNSDNAQSANGDGNGG